MTASPPGTARLASMVAIARALPGQSRQPYAARERIVAERDRRIAETVRHAAEHVPFYRELFRREGIDVRDVRTPADLLRLPTVTREEVVAAPERFRSDSFADADGVVLVSSGTTGQPLELFHDRRSVLLNVAYSERERAVERHFVGRRVRYTRLYLGSAHTENVDRIRGLAARASFRPFRPRYRSAPAYRPRAEVVAVIDDVRPDVLIGSGSVLEAFYRESIGRKGPSHRPSVLLYTWDHMTDHGRELIEREHGIPVISRYSAMEALKIGFFCEEREGFHLHEDLCHLWARGRDGRPLPDGEPGEIALTNLVNRGSAIVNYRIGDLGVLGLHGCRCGRATRMLTRLEGRVNDDVVLPDGTIVGAYGVSAAMLSIPGILRSQLVQRSAAEWELRLQTADAAVFEQRSGQAVAELEGLLPGIRVTPVRAELPLEPGRKHRPVVTLRTP